MEDLRLIDEEGMSCDEEIMLGADLGLLGLEIGRAKIILPAKKPNIFEVYGYGI